ncbi:Acyl-CoA dehydrogenase family member 9, mitochondrial [Daphnia magna]|uniref:Complex I assembly factor ACAD9, mitochondrial n=1 Tax=Daphnia magna TaxID=35525 RepID=A0A164RZK9_9CRUS|nr:Acyl-CoA dehydrogenase family member 9, mitochondrial [Daphnia magna]
MASYKILTSKSLIPMASRISKSNSARTAQFSSSAAMYNKEIKEYKAPQTSAATEVKKLQRPPFGKNLFLGKFDTDILAFPEVLDKERLQTLEELVAPVEKFFESIDSKKIDAEGKIPKETYDGLKALGLFGQQIPTEYGGLGFNATEFARLAEITALDASVAGLLIAGNEEQKAKYLPRLATGEWTAAFCLTEPSSGSDAASVQTRATLSDNGDYWIMNGNKIWISNGGIADFFTVFAKTQVRNKMGEMEDRVTAFLVERNFGGVTHGKPEDKLGIRGSNTCQVYFENVPIPKENVLGEVGAGFKIALNILNSGRFSMGSSGAGMLKKLIGWTAEHAVSRKQFGKALMEFELIQEKFAKMACTVYAMESMAYLTSAMLDTYEEPDCAMEAAMVKVFSSEGVWNCTSECLQILGGLGYMKDYPYERYLRDARILLIFEGTNEILRILISLLGLQHAGKHLADMVRKLRNPTANPGFVVKSTWERLRRNPKNPKLTLQLNNFLHPSVKVASELLEKRVLQFQMAVETLLARHGKEVGNKQMDLRRVADVAIDLFAMSAVVSRSSRSYCIGLRNAQHEVELAHSFCVEADLRCERLITELFGGDLTTQDLAIKKIAQTIFQNKGYCAEHPLKQN